MANNIIKRVWNQGSMTPIEDLQGSAFTNENGGHTFQISGVDSNGESLALSGTIAASFLRPDQTTVGISGSVSGGVASVTLSEECYGVPGRFGLVIFMTSDGKKTAIYSCVGNVARSSTDAVAPGVVADVVDLINEIETAVGTIPASYSALMADIAPTYSSSALYAVGDYAWYEGDLKRCIVPITVGETYTPAHWTSAVVGDDVCALKGALSEKTENLLPEYNNAQWTLNDSIVIKKDGCRLVVNGTKNTSAGAASVTDVFTLPTGTYHIGSHLPLSGTGAYVQIVKVDGSTTSEILKTTTHDSFTLSEATNVRLRIYISASKTFSNLVIEPMLFENAFPSNYIPQITAVDYPVRGQVSSLEGKEESSFKYRTPPNSLDLNDYLENGWYVLDGTNNEYENAPDETASKVAYMCVYSISTYHKMQTIVIPANAITIVRRGTNNPTVWTDWKKNESTIPFDYRTPTGTDLDDYLDSGWYVLSSGTTYTHVPEAASGKQAYMCTYSFSTYHKAQVIYAVSSGVIYVRNATGNPRVWSEWGDITDNMFRTVAVPASKDFDDCEPGITFLSSSEEHYIHSPIAGAAASHIITYINALSSATYPYKLQYFFRDTVDPSIYIRRRTSGTWTEWKSIYRKSDLDNLVNENRGDTISLSFTRNAQPSQGDNSGTKLKVMSYNICMYNGDTSTYISDEQLFNLKKMFYRANADFVCLQEDRPAIDGDPLNPTTEYPGNQSTQDYVYNPMYPHEYGDHETTRSRNEVMRGNTIHSKLQAISRDKLLTINNRTLMYAVYNISETISLLLVSFHPIAHPTGEESDSQASIAARAAEYAELFDWLSGEKTLKRYVGDEMVSVPTHTHCIICGDFNSHTTSDQETLEGLAEDNNFILGNGGAIGWFVTNMRHDYKALDNIIVSDNVIINSIESYNSLYSKLYSDHVPVVADLTLL